MTGSEAIITMPPPPATRRVRYGDGQFHFGDVRVPKGDGPFPFVMNIHGGFWRSAYDLHHAGHLCAALARAGIATWNIEYRRLGNPGGGWTGTFEDVARAADFLPTLAQEVPLDVGRAVVMGHSAGGHLALWAAARPRFSADNPFATPHAFAFQGVVSLAGVADLARAWELGLSSRVVDDLLGGSPTDRAERYRVASPIELVPIAVPQILIHGEMDTIVPLEIAERYYRTAHSAGDNVRLERLPRAGHFELIDPFAEEWAVMLKAVQSLVVS